MSLTRAIYLQFSVYVQPNQHHFYVQYIQILLIYHSQAPADRLVSAILWAL